MGVEQLPRIAAALGDPGGGVIDVAALQARRRHDADSETAAGPGHTAPETEVERRIAAIWQETLGVAQVGRDDNFFELAGTRCSPPR